MTRGKVAALLVAALAIAGAAGLAAGARFGWLAGSRPADLGFREGRFAPGDARPNWVSSTVAPADAHHVAPIEAGDHPVPAWVRLQRAIEATPRARIVRIEPGYLHAEFASERLGFVDDAQFALDPSGARIHVKSGARLGIRDFGVNRARVEALRAAVAGAPR